MNDTDDTEITLPAAPVPAKNPPPPPGGGSWTWDEAILRWISNDQPASPNAEQE